MGLSQLNDTYQNLGKYALIEKIGEGRLGPVYRGFDQDLGTPVVVRILCDGIKWNSELAKIFAQETRAITGLRHPNIAAVLDIGNDGSNHFIVMESLGGETLGNLIARHSAISVEAKISIMIHVSEGLSYAHKHGILHRDLVPRKIHLAPNGSAKIRDFALAYILMKYLPHPIVRWGAPIYLCPEQIQHKDCDARSDIFSAGTIFYELHTHVHPFHDRDGNKALDNILSNTPIPTFEKFPDAPPGIWAILRSCLARDPQERYRSADELIEACRKLLVSLAEDKRLILSELYAALAPLKKAAAQPNAAPSTIALLGDVQSLLRGEKEADYATLDRLMTNLTKEYPSIQTAACAPPGLGPLCPQIPPDPLEDAAKEYISPKCPEPLLTQTTIIEPGIPSIESGIRDVPPTPPKSAEEQPSSAGEPADPAKGVVGAAGSGTDPVVPEESEGSLSAMPDAPSNPIENGYVPLPPSASRYLKRPRPSYRTAVILLSILVIAVAGYIVMGTDAASPIRKAWNMVLPDSNAILHTLTGTRGNAVEVLEHFSLAHDHGLSHGACRGILALNSKDVSFAPASGSHEFHAPFRLLTLKVHGKFLGLYYISDNSHFQTFEAPDLQTADKFRKRWDELKAAF